MAKKSYGNPIWRESPSFARGGAIEMPTQPEKGYCVRCREVHKHHCETTNQVDGQFLCVHCEDNLAGVTEEVCPQVDIQTRWLEVQKKRVQDMVKVRQERNGPLVARVVRVCEHDGCATVLSKQTKRNYCKEHYKQHKPEGPRCAGEGCGRKLRFKKGDAEREFCRACEKKRAAQVEARVEETMKGKADRKPCGAAESEGCTKMIFTHNKSGYCSRHFFLSKKAGSGTQHGTRRKQKRATANGAALVHARGRANGAAAEGMVMIDVRLVDYIIASLPPQKRAEMLNGLAEKI